MAKSDENTLSPHEMGNWLREEVRRVMKTAELQITDATDFVTGYTTGKLSGKEATERFDRYGSRWGESPLISAMPKPGMSNEEILRRLDAEIEELDNPRHQEKLNIRKQVTEKKRTR
jgi:hypothetical protein